MSNSFGNAQVAPPPSLHRESSPSHYANPELLDPLVARAVGGDKEAKANLMAELMPTILGYCRFKMGGRTSNYRGVTAEDVAQEVAVAVLGSLDRYKINGPGNIVAYAIGIASNKVVDSFRSRERDRSDPTAEFPEAVDRRDGPVTHVLIDELGRTLGAALAKLPERQREIVLLRVVYRLSAEETADVMGSTPGAVRVGQHRGLARLRKELTEMNN